LIFISEIEQFGNGMKEVECAGRRDDDARIIACPGARICQRSPCSFSWNASGRPGALHVHTDDWVSEHAAMPMASVMRAKRRRRWRTSSGSRYGRADDHVHHANSSSTWRTHEPTARVGAIHMRTPVEGLMGRRHKISLPRHARPSRWLRCR